MNSLFILLSVIMLVNAKPADYNNQYDDDDVSTSDDNDEKSKLNSNVPTGVFTKYPEDPYDSYKVDGDDIPTDETRNRRQTNCNEADSSLDVNKHADKTDDVKRPERKTDEQAKVPLRSFIDAIESDLVAKALEVNSHLRKRRSTERVVFDKDDDDLEENKNENDTDDAVDVNKNFFEGLFNYTRPHRETEDKDLRIPLNELVQAVETTLVQSAKNLKETKHSKRDASSEESSQSNESSDEAKAKKDAEIKVEKIAPSTKLNLNLLSAITFKSVSEAPTEETTASGETETASTTEPIQKTSLTVVQASNSLQLVPSIDKKLGHVQHQEISKTVFQSSLAIFPTIPPTLINVPLPHITTTEEPIETTTALQTSSSTSKSEGDSKHEQLLQKAQKLKEKIAEIQAEPVILSQF